MIKGLLFRFSYWFLVTDKVIAHWLRDNAYFCARNDKGSGHLKYVTSKKLDSVEFPIYN